MKTGVVLLALGGYGISVIVAFFCFYAIYARDYSKNVYLRNHYKFKEYVEGKISRMACSAIIWPVVLLAAVVLSLFQLGMKRIERIYKIND